MGPSFDFMWYGMIRFLSTHVPALARKSYSTFFKSMESQRPSIKIKEVVQSKIYCYNDDNDDDKEDAASSSSTEQEDSRRQGRQGAVSIDDSDADNDMDDFSIDFHRRASLCWRRSFLVLIASRLRRRNTLRTDPGVAVMELRLQDNEPSPWRGISQVSIFGLCWSSRWSCRARHRASS